MRAKGPTYNPAMPQSLSFLLIHVIFSTKDRAPLLQLPTRNNLHAYLASMVRNRDSECLRAGGTADHVHLAILLGRTVDVAKLVGELKASSSNWLKTQSHTSRISPGKEATPPSP